MTDLLNVGTYYVPEGETRTIEIVGVSVEGDEETPFAMVDGSALLILARVAEAKTDQPLLLKQFGASQLLLAGLNPSTLDPGQVVEIERYEGGGFRVELDPEDIESIEDAM